MTDPDDALEKWGSHELALLHPPFPAAGAQRPYNDAERALRVVETLGTVAGVVEELPSHALSDTPPPETSADLDVVAAGCWGPLVIVVDPALASDAVVTALADEVAHQRGLHPAARIAGSVSIDGGAEYRETIVDLPGVPQLRVGGWDDGEPWDFEGDPRAILRALGVEAELDDDPRHTDWVSFADLALGPAAAWARDVMRPSRFRVERTEPAARRLRDVWTG